MSSTRRCCLTAAIVFLSTLPGRATTAPQDAAEHQRSAGDLEAYGALVDAYLAGDTTAAQSILAWTPKQLGLVVGRVSGGGVGMPLWDSHRLVAAAFMHSDAVLSRLAVRQAPGALMLHLDIAGRLLEAGAPTLTPIARRWYVAVGRVLRDRLSLTSEAELLASGRDRLPGDPGILCESGTLAEYLATDRSVGDPRPLFGEFAGEFLRRLRARRAHDLSEAAGWLTEAVEHGSIDVLCRLHLARIWSLEDDERARPLLGALQRHSDDALSYLASMFLGGWAERRNDQAEAERQYRRAIARFPGGQIAYVALSTVLLASGRAAEARDVLGPAIGDPSSDRREPWWWYHLEPSVVVDARYEALKKEALR